MALIDDIEFYGRAVDAGEMERDRAAQLLAEASKGGLTVYGAGLEVDGWATCRARLERMHADTVDSIRALNNGRPVPDHVKRHLREDALRMIRDETSAEAARFDDRYWDAKYDNDEPGEDS